MAILFVEQNSFPMKQSDKQEDSDGECNVT